MNMKLISLNMEGLRHIPRVHAFLATEKADVVCLQEAPVEILSFLHAQRYTTMYMPRTRKTQNGVGYTDGIVLASLHPVMYDSHYYYKPSEILAEEDYDEQTGRYNNWQCVLVGEISYEQKTYTIATTHYTWTKDGDVPAEAQITDLPKMLSYLRTLPPHILCGDFNIPRHHNFLYDEIIKEYTDTIPVHYKSSLDAALHRAGNNHEKIKLFTDFMVDYIFTQAPYNTGNVRLEFGISDHAAVIGDIFIE
jgi:exonuclease III